MLKAYIISTLISVTVITLSLLSVNKDIKNKYKVIKKSKKNIFKTIISVLYYFMPVINLYFAFLALIKYDEILERTIENAKENNLIEELEETI